MAKTIVHDKKGNPIEAEAVDAREMIKSGEYTIEHPHGKTVTLADVETLPGEPQYPPTPQPEHPLPGPHEVLQASVLERQALHAKGEVPKVEFDKDGKPIAAIKPVAPGQPFNVAPHAPQFADSGKLAPTPTADAGKTVEHGAELGKAPVSAQAAKPK